MVNSVIDNQKIDKFIAENQQLLQDKISELHTHIGIQNEIIDGQESSIEKLNKVLKPLNDKFNLEALVSIAKYFKLEVLDLVDTKFVASSFGKILGITSRSMIKIAEDNKMFENTFLVKRVGRTRHGVEKKYATTVLFSFLGLIYIKNIHYENMQKEIAKNVFRENEESLNYLASR